jgi:hypothetical protein
MPKNKITTQGYFVRRLRDSGFLVSRVYDRYSDSDTRKWTIVVNPGEDSLLMTCCDNGEWPYRGLYEFNDAGKKFPKGYHINTDSVEVIVAHLIQFGIEAKGINNLDGRTRQKKATPTPPAPKEES